MKFLLRGLESGALLNLTVREKEGATGVLGIEGILRDPQGLRSVRRMAGANITSHKPIARY